MFLTVLGYFWHLATLVWWSPFAADCFSVVLFIFRPFFSVYLLTVLWGFLLRYFFSLLFRAEFFSICLLLLWLTSLYLCSFSCFFFYLFLFIYVLCSWLFLPSFCSALIVSSVSRCSFCLRFSGLALARGTMTPHWRRGSLIAPRCSGPSHAPLASSREEPVA